MRRHCLIINLPGSVRGAREGMEALADVLPHALDVIHFEARRSPDAKRLTFDMVEIREDLGAADYILLLCCHPAYVRQHLGDFEQALEVRQHGVAGAWIFQRRTPAQPSPGPTTRLPRPFNRPNYTTGNV